MRAIRFIHDDWYFPAQFPDMDLSGATIEVAVRLESGTIVIGPLTQTEVASWADGNVLLHIPNTATNIVQTGTMFLLVRVTNGDGKKTWPPEAFSVEAGMDP